MTMGLDLFSITAFGTQAAVLPNPQALPWVVRGLWALLLASLCLGLLRRMAWRQGWPASLPFGLAALALALSLLPGTLSPTWWLGLAFQAPSLMSVALSLAWGLGPRQAPSSASPSPMSSPSRPVPMSMATVSSLMDKGRRRLKFHKPGIWAGAGLLLGWLLLLDLLAWLPVPLYSWGFGSPALAAVMLMAGLAWALSPVSAGPASLAPERWLPPACLALCVALFVLTRWPSGNLWDALIDPWLWIFLHLRLLGPARK